MKKKIIILVSILCILIASIIIIFFVTKKDNKPSTENNPGTQAPEIPFYLEDKYYESSKITEINYDELNTLIDNKESFAVFIYQPMCVNSANFESILLEFLKKNKVSIKKIAFSTIKDTEIGDYIKYYPSFIIYNKGEVVDYLEADKDEDILRYTEVDEFTKWFTSYVKIKENNSGEDEPIIDDPEIGEDLPDKITLENVVREKNKVNIYFFWGDGCPRCERAFEFFDSIKDEYGKYYNLYTFETWHDEDNVKLLKVFAKAMDVEVTGVPYIVIGNQVISGFRDVYKKDIISAIESQYKNSYDVYFDKLKK